MKLHCCKLFAICYVGLLCSADPENRQNQRAHGNQRDHVNLLHRQTNFNPDNLQSSEIQTGFTSRAQTGLKKYGQHHDIKPKDQIKERSLRKNFIYRLTSLRHQDEYVHTCGKLDIIQVAIVFDGKPEYYFNDMGYSPFFEAFEDNFKKIKKILEAVIHPGGTIRIKGASFTDWLQAWGDNKNYCYKFHGKNLKAMFRPDNIRPTPIYYRDSTLNSVYYTALDPKMDWQPGKKVIIFFSNKQWKYQGDDNDYRGTEYNYPSPDGTNQTNENDEYCKMGPISKKVFIDFMNKNKFQVIGLLTPTIYQMYKDFFKDGGNPGYFRMVEIASPNDPEGNVETFLSSLKKGMCWCLVNYELAVVVDSTWSFVENYYRRPLMDESNLSQFFTDLTTMLDYMYDARTRRTYSLTSFGDYPTASNDNLGSSNCYKYETKSDKRSTFLDALQKVKRTYGGKDEFESGLTALLYTATEPKINWTKGIYADTDIPVVKIIVMGTNSYWKTSDNKQYPGAEEYTYPKAEGYGNCSQGPPDFLHVMQLLKNERFFLLPMIYGVDWTYANWNGAFLKSPNNPMAGRYYIRNGFDRYKYETEWPRKVREKLTEWSATVCNYPIYNW